MNYADCLAMNVKNEIMRVKFQDMHKLFMNDWKKWSKQVNPRLDCLRRSSKYFGVEGVEELLERAVEAQETMLKLFDKLREYDVKDDCSEVFAKDFKDIMEIYDRVDAKEDLFKEECILDWNKHLTIDNYFAFDKGKVVKEYAVLAKAEDVATTFYSTVSPFRSLSLITNNYYDTYCNNGFGYLFKLEKKRLITISRCDCTSCEVSPDDDYYRRVLEFQYYVNGYRIELNSSGLYFSPFAEHLADRDVIDEIIIDGRQEPVAMFYKEEATERQRTTAEFLSKYYCLPLVKISRNCLQVV